MDIISFLYVLGLFCGFNLLKIRPVYHVCMVEVYELEDFFGFLRAQSGNVCDVGVAKNCRDPFRAWPDCFPGIGNPSMFLVVWPNRYVSFV